MDCEKYQDTLIGELIEKCAVETPDRIAVKWVEQDTCAEKTYRQLFTDIHDFTERYLMNYRNNRIALCGRQDYRFLVMLLAVWYSGNSAVIVNDFIHNRENKELLESIDTAAYLAYDGKEISVTAGKRLAGCSVNEGELTYESEAAVLLTSGTTGRKKCVSLSHRNLLYDAYATTKMVAPGVPGDRLQVFGFLPFSHAFSLQATIMCMLYVGGTICLGSGPSGFMKEISLIRPAFCVVVPQILKGIFGYFRVNHIEKVDEFPVVICGGASLEEKMILELREKGVTVIQGYGTTECAPIIAVNPPYDNRTAASGKLLEGLDLRISDGEIQIRGANVFRGYINDAKSTELSFADGYFRTGDRGHVDDRGYLYVEGRLKDTIVLATGENVSPSGLEEKLMDLPSIKDAYVFEKKTGNVGCITAAVFPAASQEEVLRDVRDLNERLEDCERIRMIEFTKAPLMRTELGKIRRIQDYTIVGKENVK